MSEEPNDQTQGPMSAHALEQLRTAASVSSNSPRPLKKKPALLAGIASVAVAGAAFVALASFCQPTMGATRSCRLKWDQRRAEIDEAVRAARGAGATSAVHGKNDREASNGFE
jgi:hypothetical protein